MLHYAEILHRAEILNRAEFLHCHNSLNKMSVVISPIPDELKNAITAWARHAVDYEKSTEELKARIYARYDSKEHMKIEMSVIKYSIELAFSPADQELLAETTRIVQGKIASPDKKTLMQKRKVIQDRISRIYNRLVKECFPSFLDDTAFPERIPDELQEVPDEETKTNGRFSLDDFNEMSISTRGNHREQDNIPRRTVGRTRTDEDHFHYEPSQTRKDEDHISEDDVRAFIATFEDERGNFLIPDLRTDEEKDDGERADDWYCPVGMSDAMSNACADMINRRGLIQNPKYRESTTEPKAEASEAKVSDASDAVEELDYPLVMVDDEEFSVISQTEDRMIIERVNPSASRPRYHSPRPTSPQDLYETPRSCLVLLAPLLETLQSKVFFEPCHGNGAMTDFAEAMGIEVIRRDLYTLPEKHDFLTSPQPDYDILFTNPRK